VFKLTRDRLQKSALQKIIDSKYVGTVVLTMGSGKSKLAIDAIKENKFTNILITSPRTNLKDNWEKEIMKWWPASESNYFFVTDGAHGSPQVKVQNVLFTLENIQTCYKWSEKKIKEYDFIVFDEIHTMVTEEYGRLIQVAQKLGIKRLGLTGTPDYQNKEDKKQFYDSYCPIIFEYYDSAEDGLINGRVIKVLKYDLTNNYKYKVETKSKSWMSGEKDHYEYLEKTIKDSTEFIKNHYFNLMRSKIDRVAGKYLLATEDKEFILHALSKDLEHFYFEVSAAYGNSRVSYNLGQAIKELKGYNYSVLGTKATFHLRSSQVPQVAKTAIAKYWWAISERKRMLWNLDSSKQIALNLKEKFLKSSDNKVLLFSELTEKANKLSKYSIHSKRDKLHNQEMIDKFNSGEIRELSSCQSLTLGLNLKGANIAIFESYNGSKTNNDQKGGRLNRLPITDTATLIYIVPENTQAEVWFDKLIGDEEYQLL
jgi:superfamily II DNA or RNA helicase